MSNQQLLNPNKLCAPHKQVILKRIQFSLVTLLMMKQFPFFIMAD